MSKMVQQKRERERITFTNLIRSSIGIGASIRNMAVAVVAIDSSPIRMRALGSIDRLYTHLLTHSLTQLIAIINGISSSE